MLDSNLLDALDTIGRHARGAPSQPFGGLQLLFCGDFFQLPPVSLGSYGAGFAFDARAWRQAAVATVELRTVVRQSGDLRFIELLTQVTVTRRFYLRLNQLRTKPASSRHAAATPALTSRRYASASARTRRPRRSPPATST